MHMCTISKVETALNKFILKFTLIWIIPLKFRPNVILILDFNVIFSNIY